MNKTSVNVISGTNTMFVSVPAVKDSVISENIVANDTISMDSIFLAESLIMRNAIEDLLRKAEHIERASSVLEVPFGKKMCPTRHGCTGATNCNNAYADYHG